MGWGGPLVVASQYGDALNRIFLDAARDHGVVDDIQLVPVGPDLAELPAASQILLPAPVARDKQQYEERPAIWPQDLRWVHLVTSGIDFWPQWLLDEPIVTNAAGASAIPAAEYALAALFAHAKHIPSLFINDASAWKPRTLSSLYGTTLGIFGFGAIGSALAVRAQALGMNVVALRHSDTPLPEGVSRAATIADLIAVSDNLVLAAPLTPKTRHSIDAVALKSAKPHLHIVNVARGGLIDDDALLAAIENGDIAAATLDVTHPEPLPDGHPFYTHPHIHVSPHCGVNTGQPLASAAEIFGANLARLKAGEPLLNIVDPTRGY